MRRRWREASTTEVIAAIEAVPEAERGHAQGPGFYDLFQELAAARYGVARAGPAEE